MKIEQFQSGSYIQQYKFRSFSPSRVNYNWIWEDPKINILLSEANLKLGELNAFSLYVPKIDIYIKMHIVKEATTSSKIEGTQTEVEDALLNELDIDPEKRNDWREVQNYIEAMNYSIAQLNKIPLSTRLLKKTHSVLMQGVRGKHKNPGEFRQSQNWIGGATINDAAFIPPQHTEIPELMGDLENFLHNPNIDVPELIRIAIAHYQFETIHPFLDGNGRLGRLLITLYLVETKLLAKPTLYLSDYFEKHRSHYYENLNQTRLTGNLKQWIKFFLVSVIETSKKGIITFRKILELKEDIENNKLPKFGKKLPAAKILVNYLYANPVITANNAAEVLSVTPATANSLIKNFVELGILSEITGAKRNRQYVFKNYLNLFKS